MFPWGTWVHSPSNHISPRNLAHFPLGTIFPQGTWAHCLGGGYCKSPCPKGKGGTWLSPLLIKEVVICQGIISSFSSIHGKNDKLKKSIQTWTFGLTITPQFVSLQWWAEKDIYDIHHNLSTLQKSKNSSFLVGTIQQLC